MTDVPRASATHGQQRVKGQEHDPVPHTHDPTRKQFDPTDEQEGGSLRQYLQEPLRPQQESLKLHGDPLEPMTKTDAGVGVQEEPWRQGKEKVSVEEEKGGGQEKGHKVGGVGGKEEEASIRGAAPKGGFESSSERAIDPTHLLREGTGEQPEAHPSTLVQQRVQSEHIWQHDESGATGPAGKQEEGGIPPGYTPPEQSEGYKRRLEEAQKGAYPMP